MFDVVFFEPEIPPNTGNAIRMCANTGCRLHLVAPLGFGVDDARLRRAGLDYHEQTVLTVHDDWDACVRALHQEPRAGEPRQFYFFTTRARRLLGEAHFKPGDVLVFGPETRGLPEDVLSAARPDQCLRIPMVPGSRSLNLSNAAAVAVFEAWRQQGFAGMA